MNKGQTAIMLAAAWLLLILLLSGCGCGAPVWKAVPCTSEPADAEFYIINDQGFEVEGRYLLEAYLEVDSSGASFTFRGIFWCELLSGTEFNIEISQGGSTWKLAGVRQGSCIVLRGEKDTAVLLRCLLGEGTVKIRVQGCGSCGEDFSFSAEPGNFAQLRDMCANTRKKTTRRPFGRRACFFCSLYYPSVPLLIIVVLVEERADDVVDELVFEVKEVYAEGHEEGDEAEQGQLASYLQRALFRRDLCLFCFLHFALPAFPYHASESSKSTRVGSSGSSPTTTDM